MSTSFNESANLSDGNAMSNGLAHEILRQVSELNRKVDDVRESLEGKIDNVEGQISGEDGLRDRIKSLEVATQNMVDKETTPINIHHNHPAKPRASVKESATVVAAGGAGAGLALTLLEAIPKLIEYLAK